MTSEQPQATAEAIARRLGVRQKTLLTVLRQAHVEPSTEDKTLFNIPMVVRAITQLPDAELTKFRSQQQLKPGGENLYAGKFASLLPLAPKRVLAPNTSVSAPSEPVPPVQVNRMTTLDIAAHLHISIPRTKELVSLLELDYTTTGGQHQKRWDVRDLSQALQQPRFQTMLTRWRQEQREQANIKVSVPKEMASRQKSQRVTTRHDGASRMREIADGVSVEIRERAAAPANVDLYVGPTNAGKTYTALEALCASYEAAAGHGTFVYAGPLRMLAYEVYQKLVTRYGETAVGFLTGEEQINPTAPLLACTVEMAPDRGNVLVLDETHWIADHARGQHWTNLLLGSHYSDYHVLTAAEAVPMVRKLMDDAHTLQTRHFTRKTPLIFEGGIKLGDVPARSAVICFSRKAVYATANLLEKSGRKVGVLYGALPLPVRKRQIERYLNGTYDIMVTTDVIGHGINLPIDNVIFAQSEKYDGVDHRALHTWETAQIAGRAGRYGLANEGHVYNLTGRNWFTHDTNLLHEGTLAGAGLIPTDLRLEEAVVTPKLGDLHIEQPHEILTALAAWQHKAAILLRERAIAPSNMADRIALLRALAEPRNLSLAPGDTGRQWPTTLHETWQLISGPYKPDSPTLQKIFNWLSGADRDTSTMLSQHLVELMRPLATQVKAVGNGNADQVSAFEVSVSGVGELKMAHIMFGGLGDLLYSELLEAEDRLNEAITNTLGSLIQAGRYGSCKNCGGATAPWFVYCEDCFHQQQFSFAF